MPYVRSDTPFPVFGLTRVGVGSTLFHVKPAYAILSFLLALASVPAASAAVTVVSGNVYDNGKLTYSADPSLPAYNTEGYRNDYVMCWAAAASNVIEHWQDTYYDFHDTDAAPARGVQTGYTLPIGTDSLAVYDALLAGWTENSGYTYNAYSWWLKGGRYVESGSTLKDAASGGYYNDVFGTTLPTYAGGLENAPFYTTLPDYGVKVNMAAAESVLKKAFATKGQAVNLSVCHNDGTYRGMHAITCWGYEEDEQGHITGLLVTDSDDKNYGAVMLSAKEENGHVTVTNDRFGSWYSMGTYMIYDISYINTPDTAAATGEKVAQEAQQNMVSSIGAQVTQTCTLTQPASLEDSSLRIGGGKYEGSELTSAIIFTTTKDAHITISCSDPLNPQLHVADGAMALLNGGLTVNGGVVADGQLYIHGGDVSVTDARNADTGGGIHAETFVEMQGAGDITITGNKATPSTSTEVWYDYPVYGGGGIGSKDSFSIKSCGTVVIDNNSIEGVRVQGGGAYAMERAYIRDNASLSISGNSVKASHVLSSGGGLSAMYIELDRNRNTVFRGNTLTANNSSISHWDGPNSRDLEGTRAMGGALAVMFDSVGTSYLQPDGYSFIYAIPTLSLSGNRNVTFESNSVNAQYSSYRYSEEAQASGGALYLDTLYRASGSSAGSYGAKGVISNNKGIVLFTDNSVNATTTLVQGVARGGAVHLAKAAELEISGAEQEVQFIGNTATADKTAQGGAVYNEGTLRISGNKAVEFRGNSAKEGNDLYNAAGCTAELTWNDSLMMDDTGKSGHAVVNKGTLYLAADDGKEMTFINASVDSSAGKLVLGTDAEGTRKGNGKLNFTDGSKTKTMSIALPQNAVAEWEHISLSLGEISGTSAQGTVFNHAAVTADTDVTLRNLTLGTDSSVSVGSHTVTLSGVTIDLSGAAYAEETTTGGTLYLFDLQNMINCTLTLSDVTFDASGILSLQTGEGYAIGVDFGNDVTFTDGASAVLNLGENKTKQVALRSGVVFFGDTAAIPEPATGTLLLSALAALCGRRRRKTA